ncbi:MAG: glutathione S-transferase [Pseudomonadota bacterium]
MADTLILGNRSYSSWSIRVWLLAKRFDLPVDTRFIDFDDGAIADLVAAYAPARSVPILVTDEGVAIPESLAIAEELATRYPDAALWPSDPAARAAARALAAEMTCGFSALRAACPVNLRQAYTGFTPSADVLTDLARIETLWTAARSRHGGEGPWLCGSYSVADAFYAPVAARIATYGLPVGPAASDYVPAHLADPAFVACRAEGLAVEGPLARYAMDLPERPWPGPA